MKIAVDPGHGMSNRVDHVYDPGATYRSGGISYEEAAIALEYGLGVRDCLVSMGHDVFLTRDSRDASAPVEKRSARAEAAGCDVFVSLHLNSFSTSTAHGVEVEYRHQDDVSFATAMRDALTEATGLHARDNVQRTDLAVLAFDGPAILIELGFISNSNDRVVLLDPERRARICHTIASVTCQRPGIRH